MRFCSITPVTTRTAIPWPTGVSLMGARARPSTVSAVGPTAIAEWAAGMGRASETDPFTGHQPAATRWRAMVLGTTAVEALCRVPTPRLLHQYTGRRAALATAVHRRMQLSAGRPQADHLRQDQGSCTGRQQPQMRPMGGPPQVVAISLPLTIAATSPITGRLSHVRRRTSAHSRRACSGPRLISVPPHPMAAEALRLLTQSHRSPADSAHLAATTDRATHLVAAMLPR